jgi:hypothetical protein
MPALIRIASASRCTELSAGHLSDENDNTLVACRAIASGRLGVAFVILSDQGERRISAQGCWSEILRRYAPQNDRPTGAGIEMQLPCGRVPGRLTIRPSYARLCRRRRE